MSKRSYQSGNPSWNCNDNAFRKEHDVDTPSLPYIDRRLQGEIWLPKTTSLSASPTRPAGTVSKSKRAGMEMPPAPADADEGEMMAPPPAASNQEQQLESLIPPTTATEKEKKALTVLSEALDAMELLYTKIYMLLEAAGPRRAATDRESHFLAFMKEELSATMVSLRMRFFPTPFWEASIDQHTAWWLEDLKQEANGIREFLGRCEQEQAELRRPRHSLLRKSAYRLGTPKPRLDTYIGIIQKAERFLHVAEDPLRYKHLLLSTSSDDLVAGLGRPTHPSVVKTGGHGHVGIKSTTKKQLRWLTSADKSLRVMSIVGPAGVGKTTLAVAVHGLLERQSSQGGHYFQCRAMVEWSRNPDVEKIHRHILFQITGTVEPVVRDISEVLRHKRYFILVDDICTSDWLQVIKDWFPSNNYGSRILITTRTGSVARCCCFDYGGLVHEMQPLNELDSERLLLTKAFGSMDVCSREDLITKNVLDGILRRCGGIPLFIIGMAEWLKQHLQQHEQCESLEKVPELLEQFEQALSPTYDELPYMSRLLSLYMSMFPEGYMFEKHHLVMKWKIEWPRQTIWDEGLRGAEQYFLDLVDRNIITRIPKDYSQNLKETETTCLWQLNYFVLRFLISKSIEEGFVFTSSTLTSTTAAGDDGDKAQQVTRRLAHHYHTNRPELPGLLQKMDLSQTRSLAISGAANENEIPFEKLTYLVALDLEGWEKLKDEHLLQICNCSMFTLTYMSIRNTRVSKIPRQIYKMYSLKILDISHTKISELPSEVCELKNLKKLDARSTQIRKLPEEICKLKNLQDLLVGGNGMINTYETATKIPVGIKCIDKLETLAIVDISENSESSIVDALGVLKSMRVLAITWSFHQCTDAANRSALQSSIKKLKNLQSLSIHCGPGCPMEFLGSLSDPPENLEKFKVTTGKFDSVPLWIKRLNHLVFLQITVCKDMPHNVEILKDLPKLDCLVLGLEFIPTQEIVIGGDGFSELRKFSVDCPVPWLTFRKGAMPKLSCLELKVCSAPVGLQRVPSGTINLQRLMEVLLYHTKWCKDSPNVNMIVNAVEKEVAKHHNPINLFINDVIQEVDVERDVNLLRTAVNCLEKRRALLLPLLLYCCWLHMPVSYVR